MIGATPFCASISLLRLSQMVQILLPTEIQPNPWIFFSDKKHNWNPLVKCLQNHIFAFFLSKTCSTNPTIMQVRQKYSLVSWQRRYNHNSQHRNKPWNPTVRAAFEWRKNSWNSFVSTPFSFFEELSDKLLQDERDERDQVSSAASWVCDCAAGWHRDDFSKWRSSAQDCFPEVWIVGSTGNADVWGQIWLRKILLKLIDGHQPTGCWWHLVDYTWCQKSQSCFCLLLADPKTELSEKSLFWWGRLNKTVHLPPAVWDLLLPWVRL